MTDLRGNFKICYYYFGFWHYRYFEILTIWRTRAVILNLTLTCYVNKTTILQHGDLRDNFKPNFELIIR